MDLIGGKKPSTFQLGFAATSIEHQFDYYNILRRGIIERHPRDVREQQSLLSHLFYFADLLEESPDAPKALEILVCEVSLLIPEWLSFTLCNFTAAYFAAARTLRWIYESVIASSAATIDQSLLYENRKPGKPLGLKQFVKWLRDYDMDRVKLSRRKRRTILKRMGLSDKEVESADKVFSNLCKFVHVSGRYFRYHRIPDLVYNRSNFNGVTRLAVQTMDLTLYCLIHTISNHWDVSGFLSAYKDVFKPRSLNAIRKSNFPLTWQALD